MNTTVTLEAKVPVDIYKSIKERIRLGLFASESEVVERALRKILAEESREFLRKMADSAGITEKEMIREWKRIRK